MTQLGLFDAPAGIKPGDVWLSPTRFVWIVVSVGMVPGPDMVPPQATPAIGITMKHTTAEDFICTVGPRTEAAWRKDGWRPETKR